MLINRDHKLFGKVIVKDCQNHAITMIKNYDTKSKIAEVYILARQDSKSTRPVMIPVPGVQNQWQPLTVTLEIPGSKLFYMDTGKEVPEEDL